MADIRFSETTKFFELPYCVRDAYFRHRQKDDCRFAADVVLLIARGLRDGVYASQGLGASKEALRFVRRINKALDAWAMRVEKAKLDRTSRAKAYQLLFILVSAHMAGMASSLLHEAPKRQRRILREPRR